MVKRFCHHHPARLFTGTTSVLFEAARCGEGSKLLYSLSWQYAQQNQCLPAPQKCLHLDYTTRYKNTEALFIDVWPSLQLQEPPVYLSVVRRTDSHRCRVFRLYYPEEKHLYINELQKNGINKEPSDLPHYEDAVSPIFSYTLGTRPNEEADKILHAPQAGM